MNHHEDCFAAADGRRLLEQQWLPDAEASAALILVHGFTEHSGRYAELAEAVVAGGVAVYAADLRGHGRSEGERVYVRSFGDYVADLEVLFQRVRRREPGKPLFLFGHSMGGTIATAFALERQDALSGLIVSGSTLRLGSRAFPRLRRLAGLAGLLLPRARLFRMGSGMLSRDPDVVADFRRDPLVFHGRFPLRTAAEIVRSAGQVRGQLSLLRLPLLILHGAADVVTGPEGSQELFDRVRSQDKTLKLYEGVYHDLLHEPEKGEITADVVQWIERRITVKDRTPAAESL